MTNQSHHVFYRNSSFPVVVYELCDESLTIKPVTIEEYGLATPDCTEESILYYAEGKRCRSSVEHFFLTRNDAEEALERLRMSLTTKPKLEELEVLDFTQDAETPLFEELKTIPEDYVDPTNALKQNMKHAFDRNADEVKRAVGIQKVTKLPLYTVEANLEEVEKTEKLKKIDFYFTITAVSATNTETAEIITAVFWL